MRFDKDYLCKWHLRLKEKIYNFSYSCIIITINLMLK